MVIDKKFKGLVKEDYRYVFNGDIKTTESLEIDLDMRLFVTGSIKAGEFIEAGGSIEAGEFIEAGWSIKAGEFIEAGWSIKAGESYGIIAGLSITCKGKLSFGLKAFAGICNWREITDEDKTITCGELESGTIEYGILKETGIEESDDKTQEAMRLLKEKGYKIVKI
jgi:hypothetical protein